MRTVPGRILSVVGILLFALQFAISLPVFAETLDEKLNLEIVQLKITSDSQFVTIHNPNENQVDLSGYELNYLNADNKPTKTFVFNGNLAADGYFVLNDGQIQACYLMTLESASMSFSTIGGSVQLWHYENETTKILDSTVSWVKSIKPDTPESTLLLPKGEQELLSKIDDDWLVVKPSAENPCQYETVMLAEESEPQTITYNLLPGKLPPVRFVSSVKVSNTGYDRNPGKMAPIVNELLPNPASPQKDADDEFIELYNPNTSTFDLTGFKLAFGSDNPKTYTFPEGSVLGSGEFKAYTSGSTSISLSNSIAQVWLLDPSGKVISQSDPYENAKDGQAWALNNGNWQWTSAPSPNESNTLTSTKSDDKKDSTAAVLGITTNGSNTPGATLATATTSPAQLDDAAPLHPLVLAGVGLLALGYAVYEYRHDIGNQIFKLRRYFEARRAIR